jgi:hypothetical protein
MRFARPMIPCALVALALAGCGSAKTTVETTGATTSTTQSLTPIQKAERLEAELAARKKRLEEHKQPPKTEAEQRAEAEGRNPLSRQP